MENGKAIACSGVVHMKLNSLVVSCEEEDILAALLNSGITKDTNGRSEGDTLANLSGRDVASKLLSRASEQNLEHGEDID